jgi:hypothetical protein
MGTIGRSAVQLMLLCFTTVSRKSNPSQLSVVSRVQIQNQIDKCEANDRFYVRFTDFSSNRNFLPSDRWLGISRRNDSCKGKRQFARFYPLFVVSPNNYRSASRLSLPLQLSVVRHECRDCLSSTPSSSLHFLETVGTGTVQHFHLAKHPE